MSETSTDVEKLVARIARSLQSNPPESLTDSESIARFNEIFSGQGKLKLLAKGAAGLHRAEPTRHVPNRWGRPS
jgi:hypothetical protein